MCKFILLILSILLTYQVLLAQNSNNYYWSKDSSNQFNDTNCVFLEQNDFLIVNGCIYKKYLLFNTQDTLNYFWGFENDTLYFIPNELWFREFNTKIPFYVKESMPLKPLQYEIKLEKTSEATFGSIKTFVIDIDDDNNICLAQIYIFGSGKGAELKTSYFDELNVIYPTRIFWYSQKMNFIYYLDISDGNTGHFIDW